MISGVLLKPTVCHSQFVTGEYSGIDGKTEQWWLFHSHHASCTQLVLYFPFKPHCFHAIKNTAI